jgi:ornithine carbamoyltransferase
MANSWIEAASILGFELRLACPEGYLPDSGILKKAKEKGTGKIELSGSVDEAAKGADVLNTDVWASMGQEAEREDRLRAFKGYQINEKTLTLANKGTIVMHCLPAHRGEEITDSVIEGQKSIVWRQAENRLHIQKAILEWLLV